MPDSSRQASQRRANWVGLRTLRQHPKYLGDTDGGEPIYEVRSVRLTLRPEGSHFHLLTRCARCGQEVAGSQVFTATDLDRPSNPVICTDCVRKAGVATYRPQEVAAPPEPETAEPESARSEPVREDGRLAAMASQVQSLLAQVRDLAEQQRSEILERRQADEATQAQLQEALQQQLGNVRAEVGASDDLRRDLGALVAATEGQRGEMATLASGLAEARQGIQRLAESGRAATAPGISEDVVASLVAQQVQATVEAVVGARLAELEAAVANGLAQARFEMASLQDRLDAAVVALTNMVETQRADLEQTAEPAALPADVRATLDGLSARGEEARAGLRSLASTVAAESERRRALEERLELAVNRLTGAIESQRRAVDAALAADRPARRAPSTAGGASGGDLLDALERQLQQAEGRLALLARPGDEAEIRDRQA